VEKKAIRMPVPRTNSARRMATTAAFSLVAAAGCAGDSPGGALGSLAAGATAEAATVRLWSGPKVTLSGSPSKDGRLLSFVDWDTGDLAVRDLVTGAERRVTDKGDWNVSGEYALSSAFAPDVQRVAYAWYRPLPGHAIHYEIRIVTLDDPEPRVLFSRPGSVPYMEVHDWSPDGDWILTVLYGVDQTGQLALVSAETGEARILRSLDRLTPTMAAFSPDGRYIAYDVPSAGPTGPRSVRVVSADGARDSRVTDGGSDDRLAGWHADGRLLLFRTDHAARPALWSLPMERGRAAGPLRLLRSDVWGVLPLGAAGGQLLYGVQVERSEVVIAAVDLDRGRLVVAPAALPHATGAAYGPADWSPDGSAIAYAARPQFRHTGVTPIMIHNLDDVAAPRSLAVAFGNVGAVRWSPDGQSLLLTGGGAEWQDGAYRLDLVHGRLHPVIPSPPGSTRIESVEWSHDGSRVRYLQRRRPPEPGGLFVLEVEARTESLLRQLSDAGAAGFSPDGESCVVARLRPDQGAWLEVGPCRGGTARTLLTFGTAGTDGLNWRGGLIWDHERQRLIYSTRDTAGRSTVWSIPLAGGEPSRLFDDHSIRDLRLHPDGRRIAFTRARERFEVWAITLAH
jgi:Tol biopolymer transport system component